MAAAVPFDRENPEHDRSPAAPRVAVVTGGIGGIGTAVCLALADAGNRVVATHLPGETDLASAWQVERQAGGYAIEVTPCDVASFEACGEMACRVEGTIGPVSIVVNAAGITRDRTLAKMEPGQWHAVLRTNLDGVFNVTRQFIEGMRSRRYGRIINISSVNGQKGQFGQTNYSAAKAALLGFTRALAREVARQNVTVNAVSPGYVDTSLVRTIPAEIRDRIVSDIPVGRLARPEEIARAVAFLAEEESGYITGENLAVNGGLYMS